MSRRRGPVAGVDEVGRGPLAGPVVACAVILRRVPEGLADSKRLAPARREELAGEILRCAHVALAAASVREIDRINILQASLLAMKRAVARLPVRPARVLVDGDRVPDLDVPAEAIIGGDATVPEIQAASIVAKVVRDRLMRRLAARWPGYGFGDHVGYATPEHLQALRRLGPTPHHRLSFRPVRESLDLFPDAPPLRRADLRPD